MLTVRKKEFPAPIGNINVEGLDLKENAFYGWFPIKGDSMTDNKNKYSIPTGSIVLAREVEIDSWFSYPIKTPVLIMGEINGKPYSVCKTITCVDGAFNYSVQCTSFNPAYKPFWLPINTISRVLVIEQIKKPKRKSVINIEHKY